MIPKSVIETTIRILENNLECATEVKDEREGLKMNYAKERIQFHIDAYELLISEYKKYLEENYGGAE